MLALACSGSVAAGIKAYEFDIKTKQIEWFDRFFTMPWPSRAGLIALIPFLAQDLRVPCKRMRRKGDQKSGDDNHFQWCELLSDDL